MFQGVTCSKQQPVDQVCITNTCKISPFICKNECECRLNHAMCEIKSVKELDENIKTILKFQFFIVYSPVYRGKSIHIAGRYAIQTLPPPNNQKFCLTYDPIPRFGCEQVSFKASQLKGCVGVGVFVRQILQKYQYRYIPDAQYLNHGAYMLMTNNMLYSSTRPQQNGKFIQKFKFNENDIVKVKYNNQKVTFVSRFLEQSLDVDLKAGEHLHFGVYLYTAEDEVEIVNTFVSGE